MKLFKQKGWGCEHRTKEYPACQRCLFHDWLYTRSTIGFLIEVVFYFVTFPYWYFKHRNMDSRGFMPHEEGYRKHEKE